MSPDHTHLTEHAADNHTVAFTLDSMGTLAPAALVRQHFVLYNAYAKFTIGY